jgi:hypothetical protein
MTLASLREPERGGDDQGNPRRKTQYLKGKKAPKKRFSHGGG